MTLSAATFTPFPPPLRHPVLLFTLPLRRRFTCLAALPRPTPSLRELYTIDTPSDLARSLRAAEHSCRTLSDFLDARPVHEHTRRAFAVVQAWRMRDGDKPRPLCLDAGCGSGRSSVQLAQQLQGCDVVGVDQSVVRLRKNRVFREEGGVEGRVMLVRADMVDFWRLCLAEGVFPEFQFILYPNPYPRSKHFKRRWQGHAILPVIAALGGRVEVRASWAAYLHEFSVAFRAAHRSDSVRAHRRTGHDRVSVVGPRRLDGAHKSAPGAWGEGPLSKFEAKYVAVGQAVHQVVLDTRPGVGVGVGVGADGVCGGGGRAGGRG